MTVALDTITFWHDSANGGPPKASSIVGPAPLDAAVAHVNVQAETGLSAARGLNRNTLTFPTMPVESPVDGLHRVQAAYDQCARCHLCATRFSVVHYRGNPEARVMMLGEGPGTDENDLGQPFVGKDGRLQNILLSDIGIDSNQDVLWANMIGCRAAPSWVKKDRAPTTAELVACSERVFLMLQAVRPRVVVCLGKAATRMFWPKPPPMWSWHRLAPREAPQDWVMIGHAQHPSYLARSVGQPAQYKEYAAARSFYSILQPQLAGLTKVESWRIFPQVTQASGTESMIAWQNL